PARYVSATLPRLPFPDGAFDLVLSSHLLFTYADRLDADFHLAALLEMVRVSRGQVRIYPLVDQAGQPLPDLLDQLLAMLAAEGLETTVRDVDHEFQRGARTMLQLGLHQRRGDRRRQHHVVGARLWPPPAGARPGRCAGQFPGRSGRPLVGSPEPN
ncbi:MAG: hypothetical protein JWR70_563, partial [Modestobacter sp.]|nr:hypothetical protein [Modestobacter sp.]